MILYNSNSLERPATRKAFTMRWEPKVTVFLYEMFASLAGYGAEEITLIVS